MWGDYCKRLSFTLLCFNPQVNCRKPGFSQVSNLLYWGMVTNDIKTYTAWSVGIWRFSGPYFPAFRHNTERYRVSIRIQSKCGKMRTRKTPNTSIIIIRAKSYNSWYWSSYWKKILRLNFCCLFLPPKIQKRIPGYSGHVF